MQTPTGRKLSITPLSSDVDLDVAWQRTISKVNGITDWNLNASKDLKVDDVIAKTRPAHRDGKSESRDQAKKIFRTTLECISRFGQIAAQTASVLFGPSQQCFNAVNFVITATQEWSAVFDNLTAIMERISAFLDRLRIYLDNDTTTVKLDPVLRVTVYRVLDQFLVIMGTAHKITSGAKAKFKLGCKVIIGEDGGVKDALAQLETRVSEVTRVEITYIVRTLSEAAQNVRGVDMKLDSMQETLNKTSIAAAHLQAADDRRSDADRKKKINANLRKLLGTDETKEPWQDRQNELWDEHVPGTGRWLLDYRFPSYKRWSNPNEASLNVIAVKGEQNFGKSHLSSLVINNLLEKHRANQRVCIAWYYFNADHESANSRESSKDSVSKALRAIVWQFTQANRDASDELGKLVVKASESNSDFSRIDKLWKIFVTDHANSVNATFYVILDGFDEAEYDPGHALATVLDGRLAPEGHQELMKLRVLITGRPPGLDALRQNMQQKLPSISLIPPQNQDEHALNHADTVLYAENYLNGISFFRGELDPDIQELKDKVKATLARGVRGDYFVLKSKLEEIAKARTPDQVEEILKRADEDRAKVIQRQVKALNQTLASDEIAEVNAILTWVICGYRVPSVELMESVLRLQTTRNRLFGSLANRIEERYSDLFVVKRSQDEVEETKETMIKLRSDELKDVVMGDDDADTDSEHKVMNYPSGNYDLDNAEIAMMERIIKAHIAYTFGDGEDIFARFGFPEFFTSKRLRTVFQIHYDGERADALIARTCLIALCDKFDEPEFDALHEYGFTYFAEHLKRQIDKCGLNNVDSVTKNDVGRKLVRLLREQTFIDAWLDRWISFDGPTWAFRPDLVDATLTWLKDTDVQNGVLDMPQEKKWVHSLMADESASSVRILANIAKTAARRWLTIGISRYTDAWAFLYGYYGQLEGRSVSADYTPSAEQIQQVETNAKADLPHEGEEASWHLCVAITLSYYEHVEIALTRHRQAIEKNQQLWRPRMEIARCLAQQGQIRKAIAAANELLEREESRLSSDPEYEKDYWHMILPELVQWHRNVEDLEAAEIVSKKLVDRAIKQDGLDSTQQEFEELVTLLEELNERRDFERSRLNTLAYTSFQNDDIFDVFLRIGKATTYVGEILDLFQAVIDEARTSAWFLKNNAAHCLILDYRSHLARLLWYLGTSEQKQSALTTWEDILQFEPDEDAVYFSYIMGVRRSAAKALSQALLTRAIEVTSGHLSHEMAMPYLERLEALQRLDHATTRGPIFDVRLSLARMLYLMGRVEEAKRILRDYVSIAVQLTEERNSENINAYTRLLNAFVTIEDDINAAAAFSLYNENVSTDEAHVDNKCGDGTSEKAGKQMHLSMMDRLDNETIAEVIENKGLSSEAGQPNGTRHSSSPSRHNENSDCNEVDQKMGRSPTDSHAQQEISNDPMSSNPKLHLPQLDTSTRSCAISKGEDDSPISTHPPAPLECDSIGCKRDLYHPSDVYHCRDCYTDICPTCYKQLKDGKTTKITCDPAHSVLYMPFVEHSVWAKKPNNAVLINDAEMPLQEWLDGIKKDWALEQRSVKARERLVNAVRFVINARKTENALKAKRQASSSSNVKKLKA